MTWSEFFHKVSIKQPGSSHKTCVLVYLCTRLLSLLDVLMWTLEKVSMKQPGIIIVTLEYYPNPHTQFLNFPPVPTLSILHVV